MSAKAGETSGEWDARENLADYLLRNQPPTWDYAIVLELARKDAASRSASEGQSLGYTERLLKVLENQQSQLDKIAGLLTKLAAPAAPELSEEQLDMLVEVATTIPAQAEIRNPEQWKRIQRERIVNALLRASQAGSQ